MMLMNGNRLDPDGDHEDVHVEIEQITEDSHSHDGSDDQNVSSNVIPSNPSDSLQSYHGNSPIFSSNGNRIQLYTRVQGKRTVILPHQRKILEDFYSTGMTSAAYNLHHLHEAAANQTGLELYVIKNWVRNRRRPIASRPREEQPGHNPGPLTSPVSTHHPAVAATIVTPHSAPLISTSMPKRPCIDLSSYDTEQTLMIVKVRIADSDETDFVEVDIKELTYNCLLRSCCEELEVPLDEVAKLRKLPNVLIRKDKDVTRLKNEQELELVLKGNVIITSGSYPQSMMTLMNVSPLMGNPDNTALTIDHPTNSSHS